MEYKGNIYQLIMWTATDSLFNLCISYLFGHNTLPPNIAASNNIYYLIVSVGQKSGMA